LLRFLSVLNQHIQLLLNRFAVEDESQKLHYIIIRQNSRLSQKGLQHSGTSAKAVGSFASGQSLDFAFQSLSLVVAVVAFVIYATAKSDKVPDGAIGQADAMTNIQVEGTFGFDASQVILVVGIIAVTFAVIQIIRTVRHNRR
jgi:hypothetical protein